VKVTKVLTNKEFSNDLEKRTLKFGIEIIRVSTHLPNTPEGRVIKNQITKSGTSVGANYREANRARSKPGILSIKLKSVKVRLARLNTGSTLLQKLIFYLLKM